MSLAKQQFAKKLATAHKAMLTDTFFTSLISATLAEEVTIHLLTEARQKSVLYDASH